MVTDSVFQIRRHNLSVTIYCTGGRYLLSEKLSNYPEVLLSWTVVSHPKGANKREYEQARP